VLKDRAARALLKVAGWRLVGEPPPAARCVIIFAPHTSNWDFMILLLARAGFAIDALFLAKHTLFRAPYGFFFRKLGGISVERSEHHNLVDALAAEFGRRATFRLAMAPEGTRGKTDHWKSGFYYVALKAGVPILPVFVDAARKECGFGPLLQPTGDVERDLAVLREFYSTKPGIYPALASEIRFKAKQE
jgi:1-acyl-sn-glycerol-3-phosphate acyltransferase